MIRDPACSASLIAVAHAACSAPVCSASCRAASGSVGGRRRRRGLSGGEPGSKPKTSSIQVASGSAVKAANSSGGAGSPMRWRSALGGDRGRIGDPLQRLPDHMAGLDRDAEQGGRHVGDRLPLIAGVALRGHRGRRADALNVRRVAGVAEPADEQRHVRALAAPVGVQLVQDQELQAPGRLDQAPVPGPGQDELEHHVVGQQDVGRVRDDPRPVLRRLLAGVPVERHRRALGIADRQELLAAP